jgi:hypothetical protein
MKKENQQLQSHVMKFKERLSKYQRLQRQWKNMAYLLMPLVTLINLFANISEAYSPRTDVEVFNIPEVVTQIALLVLGYTAIITSVKTIMLFGSLAYISFGLMYAYEEILKETRRVMFRQSFNYLWDESLNQFHILDLKPYTSA